MRKFLSTSCLLVLLFIQAHAQEQRISGRVTDAIDESGLPGVNVIVKGTTVGTTSDLDGNYSLELPSQNAVLVFSYIGYQSEEVTVGNQSTINLSLTPDVSQLDEVVVVGFGERRKKDLTGSISTVRSEEIGKIQTASPQFALQGNAAGVRVVNASGNPNESPQIFVRGIGTWDGSSQPLYVIDGQIFEPPRAGNEDEISGFGLSTPPNMFNLINPNDIESMTVLKDASAAAIYGSRGANGVVLITTKKGKKGAPSVEFNSRYGVQNFPSYDMLNTQQYVNIVEEMYANTLNPDISIENNLYGRNQSPAAQLGSYSPQFDPESPYYISDRTTTYDWQDELMTKNPVNQAYDVKVSGATDRVNYYISAGYFNQEGMLKGNDLERYSAAINVDTDVTDWLKIGVNYKFSRQESFIRGDLPDYADAAPWQPLRDPSNKYGYAPAINPFLLGDQWTKLKLYGGGTNTNYLAVTELDHSSMTNDRQVGQLFTELRPIKGLMLRGSLNLDYSKQDRYSLGTFSRTHVFRIDSQDPKTVSNTAPNSLASMGHRINNIFNFQSDFTANYNTRIADQHNITLTAVVQDQRHYREILDLSTSNLATINDRNPRQHGYGNNTQTNNSFYGITQRFWFGMMGRISYDFENKYYLDLSYRRDASNGFDDDYRWGNFYSVSGAWRISDESFMDGLTFLDDLKLRGGWGQAGNDEAAVGNYAFISRVATGLSSYRWGSGNGDPVGNWIPGSRVTDFPNKQVSWEVVTTTYAGFDASMFKNKLSFTFEIFNRATDGILQVSDIPLSIGLNKPLLNIGKLENKGVDLQLGYRNTLGNFSYGLSGNISFLKNEVTSVYQNQPLSTEYGRVEVGRSIGHIWGYKVGGIFQTQAEIDAYYANIDDRIVSNPDFVAPGDMYFLDVLGDPTDDEPFYSTTPDGKLNSFDQTEIGKTIPGYTYGLNLDAGWKGFDLSINFYGEGDVQRINEIRRRFESMNSPNTNYFTSTLNRWTPQNPSTDMPRAVSDDPAKNNRLSDRWVESAAFFRINNWQLGYSLPASVLGKVKFISSVRLFVGGQNNLYMFQWSGIDPVNDEYPLPRTYSTGLNVRF